MAAYSTSLPRAAMGMAAGIVTGATLVALWSLVGMTEFDTVVFRGALVVFAYSAVIWAAGLIVFAAIPWAILHHYAYRDWWVAVGLGAIFTFLVVAGFLTNGFGAYAGSGNFSVSDSGGPTWVDGQLTTYGWREAFIFAAICSGAGALVGLVVWRTAYRRSAASEGSV